MNIPLGKLYSEGYSSLTMSLYKKNLIFKLNPYTRKSQKGKLIFDNDIYSSTSVKRSGAELFLDISRAILEGYAEEIYEEFQCLGNAKLIFEFKPNKKGYMRAYLTIKKDDVTIKFKFGAYERETHKGGKTVIETVQDDIGFFANILCDYLTRLE
jgi:hypothetical protein